MDKNDPIVVALIQRSHAIQAAEENFLSALNDLLNEDEVAEAPRAKTGGPVKKAAPVKTATVSKAKPEPEPEADDEDDEPDRKAELNAMRLPQLKALAKKRGFDAEQVAGADKDQLVDAIFADEAEEAKGDEADDSAEDEADGDEDVQFDRADLQKKNMRDLKALAKASDFELADYKDLDKDSIIDMLLGEGEYAEGEGDDADSEDEDGDDGEGYTEEEIRGMSLADLKDLAKRAELTPKRGWKANDYADALVELLNADDSDDEDDEDE